MNIVGFIRFNVPFIVDMLTVHLLVKIADRPWLLAKLSSTKSNRRVISQILRIDDAENLTKNYVYNAFRVVTSHNTAIIILIDIWQAKQHWSSTGMVSKAPQPYLSFRNGSEVFFQRYCWRFVYLRKKRSSEEHRSYSLVTMQSRNSRT